MQSRHDPLRATATAAVAEPATPAQAPAKGGVKKVSLGGIAKKKEDSGSKYPVYPDEDGKAGEIAARIAERQDQFDALKSALETDKEELGRVMIRPWYLQHFHRKSDVPSSVLINYHIKADPENGIEERTGSVRVTVKEQYYSFPSEDVFLQRRFASQLPYDIETNLPAGLVRRDNLRRHCVRVALVGAIGEYLEWDVKQATLLSAEILEDSNVHDLAKVLFDASKAYGNDEELRS